MSTVDRIMELAETWAALRGIPGHGKDAEASLRAALVEALEHAAQPHLQPQQERTYVEGVRPIWGTLAEIGASAPPEAWAKKELTERERFEDWYCTHAFDYVANPVGSRDCGLQWAAWQAALASKETP